MNCPKCGEDTFSRNSQRTGIPDIVKTSDNKVELSETEFFPVRTLFCRSCNYVELKYDPDGSQT